MNLFAEQNPGDKRMIPLAERLRPQTAEAFIGQAEIFGEGKILRRSLERGQVFSMILWGPPGSGKTTLAKLIARQTEAHFHPLNAVSSGVKEVRQVIRRAEQAGTVTILFIDEIHRFNKAQQDALLHAVEAGLITLIGATTENPSFEVIAPLLSRCRVLRLHPLADEELQKILDRALATDPVLLEYPVSLSAAARDFLIGHVGGDARRLLNGLEIALQLSGAPAGKALRLEIETIREALQQKHRIYDKKGDYHYDAVSALIKSIRGSDPDAGLYWLSVMLESGEDPLFVARRLVILASEDIGNAAPLALSIAVSGYQAVMAIGMPEAAIVLAQLTTYLASMPKSNAAYLGLKAAQEAVSRAGIPDIPLQLRNAPTPLMKELKYGRDYRYPHDFPEHFVDEDYFPAGMKPQAFYRPTEMGREKAIRDYLETLWKERYRSGSSG